MGKVYEELSEQQQEWIKQQRIFFVATAPLSEDGHVNVSPKGLDTFRIINETTVAYLDLTGSGIETIAHLKENGRITIMFCAFDGPPKILRLYGKGIALTSTVNPTEYNRLLPLFKWHNGGRAIIKLNITRIADSCGYSIPLFDFKDDRDVLDKWTSQKGSDGLIEYRQLNNKMSIDNLDGLTS